MTALNCVRCRTAIGGAFVRIDLSDCQLVDSFLFTASTAAVALCLSCTHEPTTIGNLFELARHNRAASQGRHQWPLNVPTGSVTSTSSP